MISEFGKYIRKIRNNKHESLRTMSKNLGISAAFLSAMEVGKKNVPFNYLELISNFYMLTKEEIKELENSIIKTNQKVAIDLKKLDEEKKDLSISFARQISNADPELVRKLREVLNENKD